MLSVRTPLDISSVYPNNLGEPSGAKEPHSAVQGQHLTSWILISLETHVQVLFFNC